MRKILIIGLGLNSSILSDLLAKEDIKDSEVEIVESLEQVKELREPPRMVVKPKPEPPVIATYQFFAENNDKFKKQQEKFRRNQKRR